MSCCQDNSALNELINLQARVASIETSTINALQIIAEGAVPGPQGDEGPVGDTGAPGGNVMSVPTFASIPSIPVLNLVGVSRIATSSWATPGTYRPDGWGRATYTRFTAPLAALPAAGQGIWWSYDAGGVQAWYLANEAEDVFLDQLGAVFAPREAAIDTRPAWEGFQSYALWQSQFEVFGFYPGGATLRLRPGYYRLSGDHFDLKVCQRILGPGNGFRGGKPCTVEFDAGCAGFIVQRYNTLGYGMDPAPAGYTTGADGSEIAGFNIECRGKGGQPRDGVWMRARAWAHDLNIKGFSRHGLYIYATAGSGDSGSEGNANNWQADRISLLNNGSQASGGSGICVLGADVNAGAARGIDSSGNYEWGIDERSFLGNTYDAVHTADNGLRGVSAREQDAMSATCYYKPAGSPTGFFWAIRQDINQPEGTNALLAATTQPGTNPNVWFPWRRADGPDYFNQPWANGSRPYVNGGAIRTTGNNAPSMFSGPYSEGGQPPIQGDGLAQFDGGLLGSLQHPNTNSSFGGAYRNFSRPMKSGYYDIVRDQRSYTAIGDRGDREGIGQGIEFHDDQLAPGTFFFGLRYGVAKSPDLWINYLNGAHPFGLTGGSTMITFGRDAPQPYTTIIYRMALGGPNAPMWERGTAAGTGGRVAEIVWNDAPTAGGYVGWINTPSGWKRFGAIEA